MSRNLPSTPSQPGGRQSSAGLSSSGNGRSRDHKPAVESAVTRLLVSIKQLLESLTQWSQLKIDENAVSDVYVRLGNEFNAAVQAFAAFSIDMTELVTVPDDLRSVLEQCLAEDATPENLELYLPTIRGIITSLLQGLRGKQSVYRRIVSDNRRSESGHERTGSKSSRSAASVASNTSRTSHRSQRSIAESETPVGRDSLMRRSGHTSTSSRRRDPSSPSFPPPPPSAMNSDFVGGFAPSGQERREPSEPEMPMTSPPRTTRQLDQDRAPQAPSPTPPPPPSINAAPSSMKRYSLVDAPSASGSSPNVVVEPSSPDPPATPPPPTPGLESTPAIVSSLAALKKSDTLERRASKRFSTYNISKMTGLPRERSQRSQANRRSFAASNALTATDLATLTEADDDEEHKPGPPPQVNGTSSPRPVTPSTEQPLAPPLPPTPQTRPPPSPRVTPEPPPQIRVPLSASADPSPVDADPSRITIFLQVGREVKKATIERGLPFSSLRVLFVDRFSYNPGSNNFPAIYIRDPTSGVQYELEDIDEIKANCLLSLNIEPLDQIKQHIDSQISHLSHELKEMRTVIVNQSIAAPPMLSGPPLAESTPAPIRPSDRQFNNVARRLSRFVAPSRSGTSSPPPALPQLAQFTGTSLQPQITGGSIMSEYSTRVVSDLKTQFDEVQNLRRDLGVMRQLYVEFMKQTKDSLGTLRSQTKSVKQLATAGVGGSRGFIESGKTKLDERSQNILTEIEKLQDSVEGVKDDVIKRHATPKVYFFKALKRDVDKVSEELESLQAHIHTIKPMWKKTWEEELQNIVEEQQFLTHQEEFLEDLREDHKALAEVYGHIQQVISIRGTTVAPRGRGYRPPPADEGHAGLPTVLMELRGAQVDPEKRLKAIEANQRIREKELASRSTDELQAELSDFVGGGKLKMTGGAEEAERLRQKRDEQNLKAMFSGGTLSVTDMSTGGSAPPSPSSDYS